MREERRSPNLLLSVIVPAYNEAATVEVALRRIRAIALRLEIIIVNDASTDGTREIAQGFAARLPGFAPASGEDRPSSSMITRASASTPCSIVGPDWMRLFTASAPTCSRTAS